MVLRIGALLRRRARPGRGASAGLSAVLRDRYGDNYLEGPPAKCADPQVRNCQVLATPETKVDS